MSDEIYRCDGCGHEADPDDLPAARGLYTDKECPECGALCFPFSDEDPVWVLWVESRNIEEFPCREDAEQDMQASESRGCRGVLYTDHDEAKRHRSGGLHPPAYYQRPV